ncbi:MAG: pyruvate formate-lyase-activating protein [Proteiniphilum sp.]|jgi:pyruvate formate lyase activating enzyme|uniref:pyruvate formate-lyase-activating protein n=1 Tax=Proteiniphilum sp. TaxID=1926877 RepID=UPI002B2012C0|nr:pyruvate formate-lyase-activating protein [Proteiniphilum sp.]MEA5062096.1 pyruvate formate-lyase-activating protein [Petrimonas sp.]MEA5128988.1 pyruvate formate-lyase-activating protein [Proteiniphilum sp.]
MVGRIHSLESFGTVDGPGIRFVVFLQGCPLRCLYCHNPDTWDPKQSGKYLLSPEELLEEVLRYKSFIAKGGVTVTGGEPLMQPEFLYEFYSLCKENGLHTALDTSGAIFTEPVQKVYDIVDLVLLDVKSIDPNQHKELTGVRIDNTLQTLNYLEEKNKPTWVRHVIVPGWTDDDLLLKKTADYLVPYRCIEKVELLPYHDMGTRKYEQLGMEYRLKNTLPLSKERLENARTIFRNAGFRVL